MSIYPSINGYPNGISVDMSTNDFSVTVAGSAITDFQIVAYDIFLIPNTVSYNSGKIALSPYLKNGDTLTHSPTVTFPKNRNHKWTITTWNGTESAISRQFVFGSYTNPTISMTVPSSISTQEISLTGVYSQAESIDVNSYTFELYDELNSLLDTTEEITGYDLTHTFTGLDSPAIYGVRLHGLNQVGMSFDTGIIQFDVLYDKQQLVINPVVTANSDSSILNVFWGDVVQIPDTVTGTYSFQDGFYANSKTLKIDMSSSVEWTFDIPIGFTAEFRLKLKNGFTGIITEFKDGLIFGYENGSFYLQKGVKIIYPPQPIYGYLFHIVITPTKAVITSYEFYNTWGDYVDLTWQDVDDIGTWNDVLRE